MTCDECADTINHPAGECPMDEINSLLSLLCSDRLGAMEEVATEQEIERIALSLPDAALAEFMAQAARLDGEQ